MCKKNKINKFITIINEKFILIAIPKVNNKFIIFYMDIFFIFSHNKIKKNLQIPVVFNLLSKINNANKVKFCPLFDTAKA